MNRFETMQNLLHTQKFFKLVCGAGNENAEEVKRLTILYTLAGAKGFDVSANVEVVKACMNGIDFAYEIAHQFNYSPKIRPFITVSVGMPGDNHVRKAEIDLENCTKCGLCISTCPTEAIVSPMAILKEKCIGCGNCGAICPSDKAIIFSHNRKQLMDILPKCMEAGAEQVELHAAIANDNNIMEEWKTVNDVNPEGHVSMCLDRLHLSNFALEERVKKALAISGNRLIIQADGYPMSGGCDDFNTTLQAVATADVINKRFNSFLDRKSKKLVFKKVPEVNVLLSGGTNSLTSVLARMSGVNFQGTSLGTFARKIVKEIIGSENFYENMNLINSGRLIARKLVVDNIGEFDE